MSYQVLARKWRPLNFSQLVGQEHVLQSLVHALDQDRLHHAYLFTGTRGVGKTTVARILAKCLNCETGITSKPCNKCASCCEINEGRFVDLIEIDAASRTKVEDTREILDNVQYAPTRGRFKIYLIDEVHMLSTHSFNALLKTLEEPPARVKFLLATTDPQKLPVTVLSRCLQFHLKNIAIAPIVEHLTKILIKEKIKFQTEALNLIAHVANGSLRDALSLLDQAISYCSGEVKTEGVEIMLGTIGGADVLKIAQAILQKDATKLFAIAADIASKSIDYASVLASLSRLWYQMSLQKILPNATSDEFDCAKIAKLIDGVAAEELQVLYQISIMGRQDLPLACDPKTGFEMSLLRMLAFLPLDLGQTQILNLDITSKNEKISANKETKPKITQSQIVKSCEQISKKNEQKSIVAEKKLEKSPDDQHNSEPLDLLAEINWLDLVKKLHVSGMTAQLARNSSLDSVVGNMLKLTLNKTHEHLLNDRLKVSLQKVLTKHFNQTIKLNFHLSDEEVKSHVVVKAKQKKAMQDDARRAILEDENVKYIQQQFNAAIAENSIK